MELRIRRKLLRSDDLFTGKKKFLSREWLQTDIGFFKAPPRLKEMASWCRRFICKPYRHVSNEETQAQRLDGLTKVTQTLRAAM